MPDSRCARCMLGDSDLPPSFRPRPLTEADRAIWTRYTGQIAPLQGHGAPAPPKDSRDPQPLPAADRSPPTRLPPHGQRSPAAPGILSVGEAPGGLDGASWQRLRGGKLSVERKLDLHGMTVQRAYHALVAFLRSAHADRLRCVEVITGRGGGDDTGVLRRELPLWLNRPDIRPLVLAAAHPHAANPGAVRLLLRRVR